MDPYKKCLCFGAKIVLLTDQPQFSTVCTLIDHKNDVKMFKTRVEPQAVDKWFHCKVLNILNILMGSGILCTVFSVICIKSFGKNPICNTN